MSPYLGKVRAVHRLCESYNGIYLTTEENHGKTSVRVNEKCQLVRLNVSTWPPCDKPGLSSTATG